MNILVFSWRDQKHPRAGGAEQVMHEHEKGWVKYGHSVTLFTSKSHGLPKNEDLDGVHIIRQGYHYLGVQLAAFFYYLKNAGKFDIVIDEFHGLPFLTPLYVRKPKLSVIQESARKVWFLNPLPWPVNWIVGAVGYLGEPFIFLFYLNVKFMTGSESAKDDVVKLGIPAKNITVVPHGVIIRKPDPLPKKDDLQTVVFLGILSKDKGIEDAVRCFSLLNKKGDYQFWVIGRPETVEYGKKIENLVKKLGLAGKVKFWGFVSQEEKFKLLAQAHILVNPSVHEGWGLVNIEANAVGTPVVAYKSAGLVDSVADGSSGLICSENTPENLTSNIIRFLNDRDYYLKLKEGAKRWSENFKWEKSIAQSLQLLDSEK